MADESVADQVAVEEGLAYWAERLAVSRAQLELAVAAWRAAQKDPDGHDL